MDLAIIEEKSDTPSPSCPHCVTRNRDSKAPGGAVASGPTNAGRVLLPQNGKPIMPLPQEPAKLWETIKLWAGMQL